MKFEVNLLYMNWRADCCAKIQVLSHLFKYGEKTVDILIRAEQMR
jgi:hypothetical protein